MQYPKNVTLAVNGLVCFPYLTKIRGRGIHIKNMYQGKTYPQLDR